MGPATLPRTLDDRAADDRTARHRADIPALARLRRDLAHLLAGRDLYADDRELRPLVHARSGPEPLSPTSPA